jgi:hypothetical protein
VSGTCNVAQAGLKLELLLPQLGLQACTTTVADNLHF